MIPFVENWASGKAASSPWLCAGDSQSADELEVL